jgi:hypothetical protein
MMAQIKKLRINRLIGKQKLDPYNEKHKKGLPRKEARPQL